MMEVKRMDIEIKDLQGNSILFSFTFSAPVTKRFETNTEFLLYLPPLGLAFHRV